MSGHEVKMIILSTDDLDESIRFYSETLGMVVEVSRRRRHRERPVRRRPRTLRRGLLQAAGPMSNTAVGARATEAMGLFVEAVDQIPSASWDLPSNLEGWSIRDLVAHTTGTAAKIVALVEGAKAWEGSSEPDDWKSDDPAGQLRGLAARLHDALAEADLDALTQALTFPIVGLTIHNWDVYRSQHRPLELPEDLFSFCRQAADSVPEDELRRPGLFGPAQSVPEDATPTDRLMAYFGRPVA